MGLIGVNVTCALDRYPCTGPCEVLRLGAWVQRINRAVRYPDALVTCSRVDGGAYLVPGVIIVVEVAGPRSDYIGRIIEVREYAAVPSSTALSGDDH
jgi:hypothetical protein